LSYLCAIARKVRIFTPFILNGSHSRAFSIQGFDPVVS